MSSHDYKYLQKIAAARPTPYFLCTAIVHTLCVAKLISPLRARSRPYLALWRAALRSGLPLFFSSLPGVFSAR